MPVALSDGKDLALILSNQEGVRRHRRRLRHGWLLTCNMGSPRHSKVPASEDPIRKSHGPVSRGAGRCIAANMSRRHSRLDSGLVLVSYASYLKRLCKSH
ncbi:hypothetical protein A0H81_01858 [Grifola frondosa]|uniref:Uncharacterized protein n=1 Tax=Grifola frondosa TaxID=5627 RepID=A0A1C7MKF3_GRIFR|nr:hypothetical protein A0H81_01858 [Grifola frondosa]